MLTCDPGITTTNLTAMSVVSAAYTPGVGNLI